jgi:hypothetical protein
MSRAQQKSSPTDRYAKRAALAITKGRPPRFDADAERYCESSPREIFAALAGMVRHLPPAGNDKALGLGYVFVLERLLEHLRNRADRGYADAAKLIAEFQAEITARAEAGEFDGAMLAVLSGALHQAKIPASPQLTAATTQRALGEDEREPVTADVQASLTRILQSCGGDPFAAANVLIQTGHARPTEHRGILVGALARAGRADARAAAVLFLLDPDSSIRREVTQALTEVASSLTATDVRRLIAMRNWRPETERAEVDAILHKARAAGVECARWEAGRVETAFASAVDGSGGQALMLISPKGRKKVMCSILTKDGVAEVSISAPQTAREIDDQIEELGAPTLEVSRPYIDRMVAHHLAFGIDRGEVPPPGLLEIAETIGGADWQPARMNFRESLAGLIAEIPNSMREPNSLASVLRESADLADLEFITGAWFEDDVEVATAARQMGSGGQQKVVNYLLQNVLTRRRERWADIFLRTALWMRAAVSANDLSWRELALVAQAVADGRDLTEIGLMRDIALRTIEVIRESSQDQL